MSDEKKGAEMQAKIDELVKLPIGLLKDAAAGYVRDLEALARQTVERTLDGFATGASTSRANYDALAEELAYICVAGLVKSGEKKP